MELEYIFNELSIEPAVGLAEAHQVMDNFIEILKSSRAIGIKPNIRSSVDLKSVQLKDGYYVSNWCANQDVNKERRLYLLTLSTKFPLVSDLPECLEENLKEVEVQFEGRQGEGLTLAHLTKNPVISLNTHVKWNPDILQVQVKTMKIHSDERFEILDSNASLLNFCIPSNVTTHLPNIPKLQKQRCTSIEDFWQKKNAWFPNLEFAPTLLDNLEAIGMKSPIFSQAVQLFSDFDIFCNSWTSGPCAIVTSLPNISAESAPTMQTYGHLRKFKDETGADITCELHARLTPGAHRLHFYPDPTSKKIFIGYVGWKLACTKFPT